MRERLVSIHHRRLPHWRTEGGVYFVTARLVDALPADAVAFLKEQTLRARSPNDQRRLRAHMERYLDAGHGTCILKRDDCADVVARVLEWGIGTRYRLGSWCIMPNHLHSIVKPLQGFSLDRIVGDWKSMTARLINKVVGRRGTLWQEESYDSWLRDENEVNRTRQYILENPATANLSNWNWVRDPDMDGILK